MNNYITQQDWIDYFGDEYHVPSPFDPIQDMAVLYLEEYCYRFPTLVEWDLLTFQDVEIKNNIKKAIIYQMLFISSNKSDFIGEVNSDAGFTIGRFKMDSTSTGTSITSKYDDVAIKFMDASGICTNSVCVEHSNVCSPCSCDGGTNGL